MNVAILGLWHLGSVTAACAARAGHDVTGWDPESSTVTRLSAGHAPIAEPGLDDLVAAGIAAGRLHFTCALADAVRGADVVWIAFDTPVDDEDRADVEFVLDHVRKALPHLKDGAVVLSSSQLPVGSVAKLERDYATLGTGRHVSFACSPENLRLGKAIRVFTQPDRVIAGVRTDRDRDTVQKLFAPITDRLVWMSVESAEMTKHAINAYLATSIAFINEIATLGEAMGADAKEIERGLKTDQRIGPGAYLSPGAAFAGGTLARDLGMLADLGAASQFGAALVDGVRRSNRTHATWTYRTLSSVLAPLGGRTVAVWGLTYKPGTDTLRRSASVELCRMLSRDGARVVAFDPSLRELPADLQDTLTLAPDPLSAAAGADALVVATEWPLFREISADDVVRAMSGPIVIDAGRFLVKTMGTDARVRYLAVGTPRS